MPKLSVTYKEIPSLPGMFVGSDGSLWTSWRKSLLGKREAWRRISGYKNSLGYMETNVRVPSVPKRHALIHHLVAEAFHGPCPLGQQCRHLNGVRDDNRPSNLAWGTQSQNEQDKRGYGKYNHGILRGSKNGNAILNEEDVTEIVRRADAGEKRRLLAEEFGVTKVVVQSIMAGRNWNWFTKIRETRFPGNPTKDRT